MNRYFQNGYFAKNVFLQTNKQGGSLWDIQQQQHMSLCLWDLTLKKMGLLQFLTVIQYTNIYFNVFSIEIAVLLQ